MGKKFVAVVALMLMTLSASAQYENYSQTPFEQDKFYIGASLSGFDLNYNGDDGFNMGVRAQLGYMLADNVLAHTEVDYNHNGSHAVPDRLSVGVGVRYYIEQNGLFLGINGKYVHAQSN